MLQPTTTTPTGPASTAFEPPDVILNEALLADRLSLPINAQNFPILLASNYLMAMAARDRKVTRQYFDDILVTAMNFQNRLVRISELAAVIERLQSGKDIDLETVKQEMAQHIASAQAQQYTLLQTLKLFREMRAPEDAVS